MGSGLSAAPVAELRRAYAEWPLFNVMLDNAEMSLAKTDRRIAERYLALGHRPELAAMVMREYDLTLEFVLAATGHSRLLEDHRVAERYQVNGIPTLVVIDRAGVVSDYLVGVHDSEALRAALKKAGIK